MVNGIKYYFAVTAYSFSPSPDAVPNNLENPLVVITVVPHGPGPGQRYQGAGGDTIKTVTHTGPSDGSVIPLVIDPSKLTGHAYSVVFAPAGDSVNWKLVDNTTRDTVLNNQGNQTGDESYLVVDGMQVKVTGPPPGMKDWQIPSGNRDWTWVDGNWGAEGFNGAMGNAFDQWFSSSTVTHDKLKNVLIKFANAPDSTWDPKATPADTNFSRAYRYLRHASDPAARPEFAPWITVPGAGYAYQDYNYGVPFSAWNVETTPPTRLMVGHLENNVEDGRVDGRYWPPANGTGVDNVAGPREFFFIFDVPYSQTPDPSLTVDILATTTPMMWMGTPTRRNNAAFADSDQFLIQANHINSPADVFAWTAPGVTNDPNQAKADISMINAFPNPYYGVNTEEVNKYQRFITFSHLPNDADIKIFNLAGVEVRHIVKSSTSQFERWDLNNDSGLPVGSGLYIVHITMPGLNGATKILKVAIVQEQQILDRF